MIKFALHAWCDREYLAQADEIIVKYSEKERILEYPELYPNAAVTIQCYEETAADIDWKWLKNMAPLFPKGFTIGVVNFNMIPIAKSYGLKAYFLSYLNTYAELNRACREGLAYVYLNQPLFSSHDKIKRFGIPVRWTPNVVDASMHNILSKLEHGTWIRPEDLQLYDIIEGCIVEFPDVNGSRAEQALFKIYKSGVWEQDLGLLLLEFKGMNVANYLIPPGFGKARCNCSQKCETFPNGDGCHICEHALQIANRNSISEYFDSELQSV